MTTVAVIGTGVMGSAMARSMTRKGLSVRAWNRSAAKVEPLTEFGVDHAGSVEDAVADAGVVITMLPTGDIVASLAERFLPVMRPDAVWLQTSTVGGPWADRLMRMAADAGRVMLDSPVSGSSGPAADGALTMIVSGDRDALTRATPVLEALGSRILHVGGGGEASRVKLVINGWMTASVVAMAGTLHACRRLEIDPAHVMDVLGGGPLAMPYALQKADEIRLHEYPAGFPVELAHKDLHLLVEELKRRAPLFSSLQRTLQEAIDAGHGREDIAAVTEVMT